MLSSTETNSWSCGGFCLILHTICSRDSPSCVVVSIVMSKEGNQGVQFREYNALLDRQR
jgi:hypothetical protein